MKPAVSVVVPVRNGAATLEATLRSALGQTLRELEVLVVDDGSTDDSVALARAVGDPRLRVIRRDPAGVAASRNLGAGHTAGRYLAFLDADDLWMPDKLATQLAALERRTDAAAAYSWTDYVDREGRRVGRDDRVRHEGDVYRQLLLRDFLESASNLLVERRAFDAVGGFDPSFAGAADWDLLLRLARRFRFTCTRRVGVLYRVGTGGLSSQPSLQEGECVRLLDRELAAAPPCLQRLGRRSRALLDQYLAFKALEDPDRRRGVRRARRYLVRGLRRDPWLPLRRPRLSIHLVLGLLAPGRRGAGRAAPGQ